MVKKIIYIILCIAVLAAGCGNKPEPVKQAEKAPHVSTEARATESDKNKIKKEDLNIDGIYMDQSMSEVFARYGKPDRVEHAIPVGRICIYNINGGELRVSATSAEERGTVEGVTITGNTGLATKAGIGIGATGDEVIKAYGGKIINFSPEPKMPEATRMAQYSVIIKRDIKHNPAYPENFYKLWFYLNDDNKVIRISFWKPWSSE